MEIIWIHTKAPKINCGKSWQHSFYNLIHCFYALFLGWDAKLNLTEAKTKQIIGRFSNRIINMHVSFCSLFLPTSFIIPKQLSSREAWEGNKFQSLVWMDDKVGGKINWKLIFSLKEKDIHFSGHYSCHFGVVINALCDQHVSRQVQSLEIRMQPSGLKKN